MAIIVSCALLFVVALVVIARWGAMDLQPPQVAPADERLDPRPGQTRAGVIPRPMWYVRLVLLAGLVAGCSAPARADG